MADQLLSTFPAGEFAAFSTAKMSHFLPVRPTLTAAASDRFFGPDAPHVQLTATGLTVALPNEAPLIAQNGTIIAKFPNGKYKVMDEDYYHRNFNDPIVTA